MRILVGNSRFQAKKVEDFLEKDDYGYGQQRCHSGPALETLGQSVLVLYLQFIAQQLILV